MKVGSRVLRDQVLSHKDVRGTVIKITKEYTVVQWDNINGDWHYRNDQPEDLKVISDGGKK